MNFKKSMISIAAASLLAVGFTGCTGGDEAGATDNDGIFSQVNTPKGTVTGLVQDTNGNPVEGVKVYVAGMEATTDNGGIYTFNNVPVTNTSTDGANATGHNNLSVTIKAPAGYLGATVTVTPQAQLDHSNDNIAGNNVTAYGEAVPNTTFIDGYIAQAGTAVLPKLDSTVTGRLELVTTEEPVANQSISLDFINVTTSAGANVAQPQNGVITTYATSGYTATTDANGNFIINNVPNDSNLKYVIGNYTVIADNNGAGDGFVITNDEVEVVNVDDIQVTPIVVRDEVAPRVASVANTFGTLAGRLMLDETVTDTITVNFTEGMMANDIVENIKVISTSATGAQTYRTVSSAAINGNQLSVTLAEPLTDGEVVDLYVFRNTDLTDLAGNALVFNGQADDETAQSTLNFPELALDNCTTGCNDAVLEYLACTTGSRALQFSLMGYKTLNMNAEPATAQTQMDRDLAALSKIETYSNAFLDVTAEEANLENAGIIAQLNNVSDKAFAGIRLQNLANALGEASVTNVNVNTARVSFVAGNASAYQITVPNGAACNAANDNITVTTATCGVVGNQTNATTYTVQAAAGTTVELLINDVDHGDTVVITPVDDLCVASTSVNAPLVDTVAPTTILQNSYMDSACTTSDTIAWNTFGDGGELSNGTSDGTEIGVPVLSLTPALFDNLDAAGNNILNANQYVTADETLSRELIINNKAYDHDSDNTTATQRIDQILANTNLYDATAYTTFAANQARTIGVALSESVQNIPATASYNGTTAVTNFAVLNDVVRTDSDATQTVLTDTNGDGVIDATDSLVAGNTGNIQDGVAGDVTAVTQADLVTFATADVMAMANSITNSSAPILDLTGIQDLAGNVSDNAKVVVYDRMPPMVTRAYKKDGIVTIEFNEDVYLQSVASGAGSSIEVAGVTYAYNENSNPQTWNVVGNVLTIGTVTNPSGVVINSVEAQTYAETAYNDLVSENTPLPHTTLNINNISDKNSNTWETWDSGTNCMGDQDNETYDDLAEPTFAMVNVQTAFEITTNNTNFVYPANYEAGVNTKTQTLVWSFTHALDTQATFGTAEDTVVPVETSTINTDAEDTIILDNFEYHSATGVQADTNLTGDLTVYGISNVNASLNSSRTQLTITFDQTTANLANLNITDVIRYTNENTTGEIYFDGTELSNNKVQSDEDDNAQNATNQGYDQGN